MRASRGLLAAASGLLLAVAGCTSGDGDDADSTAAESSSAAASTTAAEEVEPIELQDCTDDILGIGVANPRSLSYECGYLDVPISYEESDSETLPMFVLRARFPGQTERIGSLVVNPGGPGGSGADAALSLSQTLPEDVLRRFDVVGFDPRGVGLTTPVECFTDAQKDQFFADEPRPAAPEQLDAVLGLYDDVAEGCADEYGDALGAFNTTDTARDMDRLRAALGDEQLTYLGYSYGTTLGSTYAELFPDRVRALVLDAAVDPDGDVQADAEAGAAALEAGFDAFAASCTALISGCPLFENPRQYLYDMLGQAAAAPFPSSTPGETRQATPGLVMTAVTAAMYEPASWPQLSQALRAARDGDAARLLSLADSYSQRRGDGSYANLFDANFAINCADTAEDVTFTREQVAPLAADWGARYPLFGADSAAALYLCTAWDAPRTPLPERDAEGSAPIVVVGNTGDPVTPLPGSVDLAEDLTSGVLVTWQGQGHTAYPKTACVTDTVNRYLIDLVVPQDGLVCPA
ncbi:alpha/beta hydrolase [Trujillonella endophytica]|uniref:Alpha/beta hydrolase fold n=1 Tax=Trujillonella endophytica TaxID=673521 RepID=A0A1H8PHG4_9ACTN|nr:alpha/beta hydrolase [Trujillella endophytica]SEO41174.1 alpha/beta hydrolase fold [Trujillella endophytica]